MDDVFSILPAIFSFQNIFLVLNLVLINQRVLFQYLKWLLLKKKNKKNQTNQNHCVTRQNMLATALSVCKYSSHNNVAEYTSVWIAVTSCFCESMYHESVTWMWISVFLKLENTAWILYHTEKVMVILVLNHASLSCDTPSVQELCTHQLTKFWLLTPLNDQNNFSLLYYSG